MVPTRGQALYIGFISMLNIFFLLGPFHSHMPQSTFVSLANQSLSVIGNRSGCLAMANLTAMLIFTARNSVLLYVTDWSHNTYLLLHRWLGYWVIFHSILHSILLLCCYVYYGDYKAELVRKYWIWGIVATVAACAILPTSVLIVRKTAYEIFLVAHVVLAIVFIVGYYLHIWYVFQYDWGLEIWAFIAAAIWGLEVLARFIRKTINGFHTATITPIADTNGEYLRIDIEGVQLHSVAYLGFPTLGWRFWETHPFSVASARGFTKEDSSIGEIDEAPGPVSSSEKTKEQSTSTRHAVMETQNHNGSTFFARTRSGVTKQLAHRIQTASNAPVRLRVVIDGPYPSGPSTELSQCSDIVCIAGGIGITAVLPFLRSFPSPRHGKLFWGCRQQGLVNALEAELTSLPASINVVTSVGQRLALADILQRELTPTLADKGLVALVVCGPPAMADEVRHCLHLLATANAIRPFILCDEAFSW